jgi:hypothetical protein
LVAKWRTRTAVRDGAGDWGPVSGWLSWAIGSLLRHINSRPD